MITLKIDVTKISKEHIFTGKKKQDGTQPKYLNCILFENKNGKGTYGDTHRIVQSIPKAARDAGERGPVIGDASVEMQEQLPQRATNNIPRAQPQEQSPFNDGAEGDDIPF